MRLFSDGRIAPRFDRPYSNESSQYHHGPHCGEGDRSAVLSCRQAFIAVYILTCYVLALLILDSGSQLELSILMAQNMLLNLE